jgi:ABC-2 type transport system ATP-binding protein
MSDVVIRARGLSKHYRKVVALDGLDLEVRRNSIFGFLGPNGAGKTTTIKLLLGLARPTAGTATLFGFDSERDTLEVRRRIGYLAQDPRYYDEMTARETLRFTARFFFAGSRRPSSSSAWRTRRIGRSAAFPAASGSGSGWPRPRSTAPSS